MCIIGKLLALPFALALSLLTLVLAFFIRSWGWHWTSCAACS